MLEDNDANQNAPFDNGINGEDYDSYLERAVDAHETGKKAEAVLFYLLAYEKAMGGNDPSILLPMEHPAVDGLKCAWMLCCQLSDRSLAEHVFERINGYLTPGEVETCSTQLQDMALDQLKKFGLSADDVDDVSALINNEIMGGMDVDVKVSESDSAPEPEVELMEVSDISELPPFLQNLAKQVQDKIAEKAGRARAAADEISSSEAIAGGRGFKDLVGFEPAIEQLKKMGYGAKSDAKLQQFMEELSQLHGISNPPSFGTLLFRSFAREDAARLMLATAVEIGQPTVRMYMDENAQGLPILCVVASSDFRTKSNVGFNGTIDHGVLILEDVDLWGAPLSELPAGLDIPDIAMAQLSSGVRKAINLIRSAADNPNVTVLASASSDEALDEFLVDLLSPVKPFDISLPGESERLEIWNHLSRKYPSLDHVDRDMLVRLSFSLSRYDMFYAAREAVEHAYKESMKAGQYVPVKAEDLYEKLAAFQPLSSAEYRQLEDAVVESFRDEIEALERSLYGEESESVEGPEPGEASITYASVGLGEEPEPTEEPESAEAMNEPSAGDPQEPESGEDRD